MCATWLRVLQGSVLAGLMFAATMSVAVLVPVAADTINVPALQLDQSHTGEYGAADMEGDVVALTLHVDVYNANTMESEKENNERVRSVEPSAEGTVEFTLLPDWNLVSVPLFLENMSRAEVFPGAVAAYTWNADARRYDAVGALDEVEPWRAYWVTATAACRLDVQ